MKKMIVFLGLMALVLMYACQKDTPFNGSSGFIFSGMNTGGALHEKFFDPSYVRNTFAGRSSKASAREGLDPFVAKIKEGFEVEGLPDSTLEVFTHVAGFPAWDYATSNTEEGESNAIIPVVKPTDASVNTIFYWYQIETTLSFRAIDRGHLSYLISSTTNENAIAEYNAFLSIFSYFDEEIFPNPNEETSASGRNICIQYQCYLDVAAQQCKGIFMGQVVMCPDPRCCDPGNGGDPEDDPDGDGNGGGGGGGGGGGTNHPEDTKPWNDEIWEGGLLNRSTGPGRAPGDGDSYWGYFKSLGGDRFRGGGENNEPRANCGEPIPEVPQEPGDGTIFDLIEDLANQQETEEVKNAVKELYHAMGNLTRDQWRWLLANSGAAMAMHDHLTEEGQSQETLDELGRYFDVVSKNPCLITNGMGVNELLELDQEYLECTLDRSNDVSDASIAFILTQGSSEKAKEAARVLLEEYCSNELGESKIIELFGLMAQIHERKTDATPREVIIEQIEAIQLYLARRRTDYGDAAAFLENLLPHLSNTDEFEYADVYKVYDLAYGLYEEAAYRGFSSIVKEVLTVVKPFISLALFETGIGFLAPASFRVINALPQSVKNSTALVWQRIASTTPFRPNTTIPETFTLTLKNGEKVYVQYSGTKHFNEYVTQRNAATYPWFESQKALRSQLVLDDFASAVDDIFANNPNILFQHPYRAGKWDIQFNIPIPTSNGNITIFHAVPKF